MIPILQKFALLFLGLVSLATTLNATPLVYWVDRNPSNESNGKVSRVNPDTLLVEDLVTANEDGIQGPIGIAIDSASQKVYWADRGSQKIQRSNVDGSGVVDILDSGDGLSSPFGLEVDFGGQKLYWTDIGNDTIRRSNLDGSNVENVITSGLGRVENIALDLVNNKIYWADQGTNKRIRRADLNGTDSGVETLITSGLNAPEGIEIDPVSGKIYWTDRGNNTVKRANLDGSGIEVLFNSSDGVSGAGGIVLDDTTQILYWTDFGTGKIFQGNADGSGSVVELASGLINPRGIALFDTNVVPEPSTFVLGSLFCLLLSFLCRKKNLI